MPISIVDDYPDGTARGNTCYVCGAGRRHLGNGRYEQVVDLQQTIDFEGYLLVCESCWREGAAMLGMVARDAVDVAVGELHEVQRAADTLLAERDEARALADMLIARAASQPEVAEPEPVVPVVPVRKPRPRASV